MNEKNPYNIYYMSSIQIDKISGIRPDFFLRYPANPVSGRIVISARLVCSNTGAPGPFLKRNHILPPQEKSLFPKIIQTNQRRLTNT